VHGSRTLPRLDLSERGGHRGIKAARAQYEAWRAIAERSQWKTPEDVKRAHPKASILKSGRVVFNINANDREVDGIKRAGRFGADDGTGALGGGLRAHSVATAVAVTA
jgi:HigB_toxin, RelE-like toxic component of a toxin-antitoxin system